MNNEELLRQALQRQNDRAARLKMPDDMERRVMLCIEEPKRLHPSFCGSGWQNVLRMISSIAAVGLIGLFIAVYALEDGKKPRDAASQSTKNIVDLPQGSTLLNVYAEQNGNRQISYTQLRQMIYEIH
ncbi:MAG: hypothetical protein PUH24_02300 [Prevotellaceae bacterium]|nr:hypothetical protein [Prevotella sp.]MDD7257108.1 hypothetical protein [Prevotellaceae bacterium]MDY6130477.1 hypothetical protein [Prevotella sp.]